MSNASMQQEQTEIRNLILGQQKRADAAVANLFKPRTPEQELAKEVAELRKEIAALRAELIATPHWLIIGQQAVDEFKKLRGRT